MALIEIEVWHDERAHDFARLFEGLEESEADSLYQDLIDFCEAWLEKRDQDFVTCERTKGRLVHVAEQIEWYIDEGFIDAYVRDGEPKFSLSPEVWCGWETADETSELDVVEEPIQT